MNDYAYWRDRLLAAVDERRAYQLALEREPRTVGTVPAKHKTVAAAASPSRSCSCRMWARCLPCIERDGLTKAAA